MMAVDDAEVPPLQRAAGVGRIDIIKELIMSGHQDINQPNDLGQTALHLACSAGHAEVAHLLLQHGADPSLRDFRHETALMKAAKGGHHQVIRVFLKHIPQGFSCEESKAESIKKFIRGVTARPTKVVRTLFNRFKFNGSKPDEQSCVQTSDYGEAWGGIGRLGPCWEAVLRATVAEGHMKIVELLLSHNIDINSVDMNGVTALAIASGYGHKEVVSILLKSGASTNKKDMAGETPLLKAAWGGHSDVLKLLLDIGVSINQADDEGMTSLHFAARKGNIKCVRLLVEEGADVHRTTVHRLTYGADYPVLAGATPVHMAAWGNHNETLQCLIRAGANIDATTMMGQTSLHVATDTALYCGERRSSRTRSGPNMDGLMVLLHENCLMNVTDVDENTPLDLTWTLGGHPQVALMLLSHGAKFSQSKLSDFRYLLLDDSGAELHYDVCRAVLLSGNHGTFSVPNCDAPMLSDRLTALGAVDDFYAWLHQFLFTPLPLKFMLRIAIRKWLISKKGGRSIYQFIRMLGTPVGLQDFLLLQDLESVTSEYDQPTYSCDSSSYDNLSKSGCSDLTDRDID